MLVTVFNHLQGYFPKPRPKKPYQPQRKVQTASLPATGDIIFPQN